MDADAHSDRLVGGHAFPRSTHICFLMAFLIAIIHGITLGPIVAQDSSTGPAIQNRNQGISDVALSKLVAEAPTFIEAMRKEWEVPGLAVAIVHRDRIVLSQGFGMRKEGGSEKVDSKTLFAIASNTKAFTAAAIAMLVEEKKLQWDDPVRHHLPWFELADQQASHDLRIRDLLCHRSGLGTFSGDLLWYGTHYTPREILERARHLKPEGPFRAHFGYSNLMFLAAGEVIEKVSGMKWGEFIRQKILIPLEMRQSLCSVRDLVLTDNYATPHRTFLDRSEPIPWVNWDNMAAAGGILSNGDEMANWMRLQLRRGKIDDQRSLFSESSSREMWEVHTPNRVTARSSQRIPTTHFKAYGLGWALADYQGKKVVSHGGGYDGMYSEVKMIPEEDFGIVVLTNSMTSIAEAISYTIVDRVLQVPTRDWSRESLEFFRNGRKGFQDRIEKAIQPVVAGSKPSHPLESYAGVYRCPMYGDVEVVEEKGRLILSLLPNPQLIADLEHLHYDTWVIRWRNAFAWFDEGTAHFVANARGAFVKLELDVPNEDLWFHELNLQRIR